MLRTTSKLGHSAQAVWATRTVHATRPTIRPAPLPIHAKSIGRDLHKGRYPIHNYTATVTWTGNKGTGTSSYKAYSRDFEATAYAKPPVLGSSDPAFLGDPARWNPEDLLLVSTAACHKLWYLHLCASAGITVLSYVDKVRGTMAEGPAAKFTEIVLHPHVTLKEGDDVDLARVLHHKAHDHCYIANSLNFPVLCEPTFETS